MAQPFYPLTLGQFIELLHRYEFTRTIDAVHMHHTWRPNHVQYRGEATIEGMWRYHTQEKGWIDIAQHVSIAPDGTIWTGRDWNTPPVSARGYNGTRVSGPFMFEIIGDFDVGCDRLEGEQLRSVLGIIASVQERFGLAPETLRFHNSMSTKTCPGTAIHYAEVIEEIKQQRSAMAAADGSDIVREFQMDELLVAILQRWAGTIVRGSDPVDAELEETGMTADQISIITGQEGTTVPAPNTRLGRGGEGERLTPGQLDALRPHVINLNQGRFSSEGLFQTAPEDVDAIFEDHMERSLAQAKAGGQPFRLLIWAHGGLINEGAGLKIAHLQAEWWKKNTIYPLFFTWETGLFDALGQILSGARAMATERGLARDFWDYTTDPAIEVLARSLGGVKIWSAMKESARLASDERGGATYTAKKLAAFCGEHGGDVEVHAVGHSAGSIFHSWFLPRALSEGVPAFQSLHFLAPAIRMDAFKERLLDHIGDRIDSLTMYTMKRDWEEDDSVAKVYRKSLLYLIYYALERERKTSILGLEQSIRKDRRIAAFFGLRGSAAETAEVVWAVSSQTDGRRASTSKTHGGFDNDRPTMNSLARRVLDRDEIIDFPEEAIERSLLEPWDRPVELPWEMGLLSPAPVPKPSLPEAPGPILSSPTQGGSGRRRALCVGIDEYAGSPLSGCVADALEWGGTFQELGFETTYLTNAQATRQAILDGLQQLIATSRTGDVVVFQFAGHGTELDDLDGDEIDGTNGPKDEALCPYDVEQGAFVIDDDIADIFTSIVPGVSLSCFIDCCHSGTITRAFVGPAQAVGRGGLKPRFLPATPQMQDNHREYRKRLGSIRSRKGRSAEDMHHVLFSACLDNEVAYESGGHGEFTVRAAPILKQGGENLTNEELQAKITDAFGVSARQHPQLDCAERLRSVTLFHSGSTVYSS